MTMESEGDEYGDEWEPEQDADVREDDADEVETSAVHPLSNLTIKTKSDDSLFTKEVTHSVKLSASTRTEVTDNESEDADRVCEPSSSDSETPQHTLSEPPQIQAAVSALQVHTRHYQSAMEPPPLPSPAPIGDKSRSDDRVRPVEPDMAAVYARIAAHRAAQFKRDLHDKEAEQKRIDDAAKQSRKDVRRSNKALYRSYGVADLSAQDRLRISQATLRKMAQQQEHAAALEKQNQCCNKQSNRRSTAESHVRQLAKKEQQVRFQLQKRLRDRRTRQQASLEQVKNEAKTIVTKNTCAYVRGSYLLQVARTDKSEQSSDRQSVAAQG